MVAILRLVLPALLVPMTALAADIPGPVPAIVERVVDGDTVKVSARIWVFGLFLLVLLVPLLRAPREGAPRPAPWPPAGARTGAGRSGRRSIGCATSPTIISSGGPAGWCAIEPRTAYPRLARSRILAPIDGEPVWSVSCFFVARMHRRTGLSVRLLQAAVRHARDSGARIVEGYPIDSGAGPIPAAFAWTGLTAAFRAAGFVEVARRSHRQPVMRRRLRPAASP